MGIDVDAESGTLLRFVANVINVIVNLTVLYI